MLMFILMAWYPLEGLGELGIVVVRDGELIKHPNLDQGSF